MGRRWGKTVLGGTTSLYFASQGAKVAWAVPSYKNGRPLWRWAENTVASLRKTRQVDVSRAERVMQFPGGGFLGIYSMDNEDSIRGEAFHLVIVDEAARIPEGAWTDAIMPTLADYGGRAILISTPKGKNWFWTEWLRGEMRNEGIASWQAPTRDNPNPRIKRAADMVKDRVPERTYRQEWLAEFVEDGGVFRRVRENATAAKRTGPEEGHTYVIGADWGKTDDFTVFIVLDTTTKSVVHMDRSNHVDYTVQRARLMALCERWQPAVVVAESNSMGMPIIEALARDRLPVRPFATTHASKTAIIDGLALAFERDDIKIINDPVLVGELQSYEAIRLPSGLTRYSAPDGMHDDAVMSLALAWSAVGRTSSAVGAFG